MNKNIMLTIFQLLLLPLVIFIILAPLVIYILPFLPVILIKVFTTMACIYIIFIYITGVFFGRAYCYYICPITALFLYMAKLTKNDKILKQKYPKWINSFFITVWFIGFVYLIFKLVSSSSSIYHLPSVMLLYCFLFAACLLSLLLIRNEDNHPMCPLIPYLITGINTAKRLGLPRLYVSAVPERCISCNACNKVCFSSLNVNQLVKDNSLGDTQKCFNCGCCSHACKFGAISYRFRNK